MKFALYSREHATPVGAEKAMRWYAAHIVLYVQLKSGRQKDFPVWENIVLLHARSENTVIH